MAISEDKGYLLFSRSFNQTLDHSLVNNIPLEHVGQISYNLLEAVANHLSRKYPLIAVGDRDVLPEYRASDAIIIFEIENGLIDWSKLFLELAKNARGIIVFPGITKGFLEEIHMIIEQGLLYKTYFFMWPAPGSYNDIRLCHSASKWESVTVSLSQLGLQIPKHVPEGGFFMLDNSFQLAAFEKLEKRKWITETLNKMPMPNDTAPLKEILPVLYAAEFYSDNEKAHAYWHQLYYSGKFQEERERFMHVLNNCQYLFKDNVIPLTPNAYIIPENHAKEDS